GGGTIAGDSNHDAFFQCIQMNQPAGQASYVWKPLDKQSVTETVAQNEWWGFTGPDDSPDGEKRGFERTELTNAQDAAAQAAWFAMGRDKIIAWPYDERQCYEVELKGLNAQTGTASEVIPRLMDSIDFGDVAGIGGTTC